MKRVLVLFGAGCIGALLASLLFWLLTYLGLGHYVKFPYFPVLSAGWLYPKVLWGGVYGLLLLIPILESKLWLKVILLSILITLVHLFIALPFSVYRGAAGLNIGLYAFLFALLFNFLWASITALTVKFAK
ncbi:hypothetical protein [uncultured Shewanella sp.]|uniref:hypothetical protein n=1 Tax=uncultured Shewanella sp. TaxID=173975 RepID=UPI002607C2A9|nr:hypothetical protein [uncultured Shewanella sp.]